jgi:SAM-dependent methyltransferase
MPIYPNLPVVGFNEEFARVLRADIDVDSILDVGAGHGGVFDYHYWDALPMGRREACDIHWIRPMSERWCVRLGVDAQALPYADGEFDVVQCMEVLEHVEDPRRALEELVRVARKFVVISSADETHHEGPEQEAIERTNVHQRYRMQPKVADLDALGFRVCVDASRRQLIAWKYVADTR